MKTLNEFIEEAASKRCPEGEYYCNTDKKCKKIPKGYKVTSKGWLRPLGGSYYTGARKNGNGNGLTAAQKKLPAGLQKAIMASKKKKK